MNKQLMVLTVPVEDREGLIKTLPVGSTIVLDAPIGTGEKHVRTFDQGSSSMWSAKPYDEYNWVFLRTQQNWVNDLLRAAGYVFLNDVYHVLGMTKTAIGALVGWRYADGELSFIDFGCWEDPVVDEKGGIQLAFQPHGVIVHELG